MRVIVQRVRSASVSIDGEITGRIGPGLVLLAGLHQNDSEREFAPVAEKILNLRVFPNEEGRFDRSVVEAGGGILLISQFTVYGDTRKGRRPDFASAMAPGKARELFPKFAAAFLDLGFPDVQQGRFGEHMLVSLENDGPVTLIVESKDTAPTPLAED